MSSLKMLRIDGHIQSLRGRDRIGIPVGGNAPCRLLGTMGGLVFGEWFDLVACWHLFDPHRIPALREDSRDRNYGFVEPNRKHYPGTSFLTLHCLRGRKRQPHLCLLGAGCSLHFSADAYSQVPPLPGYGSDFPRLVPLTAGALRVSGLRADRMSRK